MAVKKYVELLQETKEDTVKELAPAQAATVQAQIELEISQRRLNLKNAENKLRAAERAYPFNTMSYISAEDELEFSKRQITQLENLVKKLF